MLLILLEMMMLLQLLLKEGYTEQLGTGLSPPPPSRCVCAWPLGAKHCAAPQYVQSQNLDWDGSTAEMREVQWHGGTDCALSMTRRLC